MNTMQPQQSYGTVVPRIRTSPMALFLGMVLFSTLFDGISSYLIPVLIVEQGFTNTFMGFILGSSSLFGATFDFFLSRYLKNPHYRRIYLLMFGISFIFLFILYLCRRKLQSTCPIFAG